MCLLIRYLAEVRFPPRKQPVNYQTGLTTGRENPFQKMQTTTAKHTHTGARAHTHTQAGKYTAPTVDRYA